MQNPTGTFLVLEGADGSGKGTQFKLLTERLKAVGYEVEVFDFPQYESDSSFFVKKYLNGELGPANQISPYTASLFFALDRYEASGRIRQALRDGKIVLSNRYVGSNMAHQGSKLRDPMEQRSFFVWEDSLEYQLLNLPRPNLNIFLRVPAETSFDLISKKQARSYTSESRDQHEKDLEHLRNSVKTYDLLCEIFPNDFKAIDCMRDNQLMTIPEINNIIWEIIQPALPPRPATNAGHPVTVNLSDTSTTAAPNEQQTSEQTEIVISRNISLLLAQEIRAWLPKNNIDKNWPGNNYGYYVPEGLAQKTQNKLRFIMEDIIANRRKLDKKIRVNDLPRDLSLPSTPLAAFGSYQLNLDYSDATSLAEKLVSLNLPEADALLDEINRHSSKSWGRKIKSAQHSLAANEPEKIEAIIKRIVNDHVPQTLSSVGEAVKLLDASPRNEFKALIDVIYPKSDLPRAELADQIDKLSYKQKVEALTLAILGNKNSLPEQLTYKFDVTSERSALIQLDKSSLYHTIQVQAPTPRYGYEVPESIEKIGALDEYLNIFDKSLELYSILQSTNTPETAVYGVMLGHKSRFQIVCSLGYLRELFRTTRDTTDAGIVDSLIEKVSEVHPIAAEIISRLDRVTSQKKPSRKKKK